MIKLLNRLLVVCGLAALTSCEKGPGEGGNSSIKGSVTTVLYSNSAFLDPIDTFPAMDEDVFIIYGDDISFSDKTQTNFNGQFEFKYLREGSYKVYVYSKGPLDKYPSGDYAVVKQIEIGGKKETVNAGDFEIMDQ